MKFFNKPSLILTFLATTSVNANYYINVDVSKKNGQSPFVIESPYDIFGFDENGIHRSGELVDPEGFNAEGLKQDSNSVINSTLSQTLDNAYNINLIQDVVESNFGHITGTLSFITTPLTVSSVEGNSVILDNGLTSNPFPNGIEIIKNGVVETNSSGAINWQHIENVYEERTVYDFPNGYEYYGTSSVTWCRSDPNIPDGTLLHSQNNTSVRYRHYSTGKTGRTCSGGYSYSSDVYRSIGVSRTVNQLVSSTTTDYFILNANVGDTIDVYMPIRLQVSIDGSLFEDVTLNRADSNTNQLTFELPNLNARSVDFRITDLQHSTDLTGVVIQPQMLREN